MAEPHRPGTDGHLTDHSQDDLDDGWDVAPWDVDPRDQEADAYPDRTGFPCTDADTRLLIEQAVQTLVILRSPTGLGDAGATVSVLVSLAGEADSRLDDAVADARDQGYTWNQIADRLAVSISTARRRYAAYASWRTPLAPG